MRFNTKKLGKSAWMTAVFGGLTLTSVWQSYAQETKPAASETNLQTPSSAESAAPAKPKTESAEQLQARKEILSLCEKLAKPDDPSQLRPLYTEEAFKTQCGEWILAAVDMSGIEAEELDDSKALGNLKQFVKENKLDKLDLQAVFENDESMFGGKQVAEVYDLLPDSKRFEIANKCGTLVNKLMRQFNEMDRKAQQAETQDDSKPVDSKPEDTKQPAASSVGDDTGLLEMFLGGKVKEIVWEKGRATLKAGTTPSDISDEELEEMGLKRDELTESPYPDKFLNFVQVDGKWLFAGVDTAKSYASFKDKQEKFPMSSMEVAIPLIENIQITGEAISSKKIALSDYKGKVVLIDCWGTWCGPCVASLPKLKGLYDEFHDQGLEIIGVAADDKEELEQFLKKRPLPWEQIIDDEGMVAEKLGIRAYPTLLLVDREGKNVKNFVGESTELKEAISLLIDGKSLDSLTQQPDSKNSEAKPEK